MGRFSISLLLFFSVLALLLGGTPVLQADDDHERARELLLSGDVVSVESLLQKVWQSVPGGRLLELEFEKKKGRYVYEVEVLDAGGSVWEFYFDARSGELIKKEMDH